MNAPPRPLRLFYALWPDAATRAALARWPVQGRRTDAAQLHLTLAFLGPCDPALLPQLEHILRQLPPSHFVVALDRLGYFARHRIAYAGMGAVPPQLRTLQHALADALRPLGLAPTGAFHPHVTLARAAMPPTDAAPEPVSWPVRQVALVASETGAAGTHYRVLALRELD